MEDESSPGARTAIIVIGRNEGERLTAALDSSREVTQKVIYVDSGSTDKSMETARIKGVLAIELDRTKPFTAARARNAGVAAIRANFSNIEFVQFLDGDCELDRNWVDSSIEFLGSRPDVVAVCGRLRERHPEKSVYNLLCDIEWSVPSGEVDTCGGIFCARLEAFEAVGGFREDIVAGEEREICSRLRGNGAKIWRIDNEMAIHDADMTRFSQWWSRSIRCGFTYAQGAHMFGRGSHRERNRALFWGASLPIIIIISAWFFGYGALLILILYPLQLARLMIRENLKFSHGFVSSFFAIIEKFPETLGILKFYFNRVFRITDRLIEYK